MAVAGKSWPCALLFLNLCLLLLSEAAVIITKDNNSLIFESTDASFTPRVPSTGICGVIISGNPLNACTPLSSEAAACIDCLCSQFILVSRGDCSFDTKVRHSQDAGFTAVIVADDVENKELVTMAGNKRGITISAVFVSKMAGNVLLQYSNDSYADCWIFPANENIAWLVMVISFISLLGITAVFAICFLIRQQRSRHMQSRRLKESNGISYQVVKSMPSAVYQCKNKDGSEASDTCAVCLEDYVDGAKLRILPCNHRFHCLCIDAWLINWRAFCPICKQHVVKASPTPSEHTPLLSPNNSQQQVTTFVEEGAPVLTTQETCVNGFDSNSSSSQRDEPRGFSFNQLPTRSSVTPIGITCSSRQMSLQSLDAQESSRQPVHVSVEAFRASPYFTPPSFFHSSAPNVLAPLESSSSDSHYMAINCGSLPESPICESP